jgi:hypothetical protein
MSIPQELPLTTRLQDSDSDIRFNTEEPEDPLPITFLRALYGA